MRRKTSLGLIALLMVFTLFISACAPQKAQSKNSTTGDADVTADVKTYREAVETFEAVTLAEAKTKQANGDEFYLYIGGETCPYCVAFVKDFKPVVDKHDLKVAYLDYYAQSEDEELNRFIDEHQMETIPAILRASEAGFEHIKVQSPYSQRRIEAWLGLNR